MACWAPPSGWTPAGWAHDQHLGGNAHARRDPTDRLVDAFRLTYDFDVKYVRYMSVTQYRPPRAVKCAPRAMLGLVKRGVTDTPRREGSGEARARNDPPPCALYFTHYTVLCDVSIDG